MNPLLEKEVKRKLGDLETDFTPKVDQLELLRKNGGGVKEEQQDMSNKRMTQKDPLLPNLLSPFPGDLPPYPNSIRTIDVQREVEMVREARKRIRLGAEAYYPPEQQISTGATGGGSLGAGLSGHGGDKKEDRGKKVGKPSVCLFTIHDAGES